MIALGATTLPTESLARAIQHFHEFAREFAEQEFRADSTYSHVPKSGPVKLSKVKRQ
jgi:hypothetical protein